MAKTVYLVHPQQTFQVLEKLLIQKCGLFTEDPMLVASPYTVRSKVSLRDFKTFISALEGASVAITKDNIGGLSRLCEEFHFGAFLERLSQFRDSDDFKEDGPTEGENDRILIQFPEIKHLGSLFDDAFKYTADGAMFECTDAQAIAVSSAVSEQLLVDACARTFALKDVAAVDSVQRLLEGGAVSIVRSQADLGRQLCSLGLELELAEADWIDLTSFDLSMLSAEALDEILAGASFSIGSEDELLERLLILGDEYRPLLSRIEIRLLSAVGLALLAEHFVVPPECVCCGILHSQLHLPPPFGWNLAIVPDFPKLFEDFKRKQFTLLWRGSRDGFGAGDFHRRCDWHPNTLTVILDTDGNIFGGFTRVEWESRQWNGKAKEMNNCFKIDRYRKSFLFTLKNQHNVPPRRFALKAEPQDMAIYCNLARGPHFNDIGVFDKCNANTDNFASLFGTYYINDTGLSGKTFFTRWNHFQVKEIEIFEITN
jgi:hypothetical protein